MPLLIFSGLLLLSHKKSDWNIPTRIPKLQVFYSSKLSILIICYSLPHKMKVMVMVFNTTFNNISGISRRSVLLVEETRIHGEIHRPAASQWQCLFIFRIVWISTYLRFPIANCVINSNPSTNLNLPLFVQKHVCDEHSNPNAKCHRNR